MEVDYASVPVVSKILHAVKSDIDDETGRLQSMSGQAVISKFDHVTASSESKSLWLPISFSFATGALGGEGEREMCTGGPRLMR